MNRRLLLASLTPACVAALAVIAPAQTLNDSRLILETWASGLSLPTTFAFISPDEMLVFEKDTGRVRYIHSNGSITTALNLDVANDSERGGLGIDLDPDFATNKLVYLYYSATSASSDGGAWTDNRVERYEFNGSKLVNGSGPLLSFPFDASQSNGSNHDGGVIRFGPDGMLYGQTGDLNRGRFGGGDERIEQNTATSGSAGVGGMFRVNPDGSVPADNPFVTFGDPEVHLWWTYGLRNGFGMDWDPLTGTLWDTENGPNVYDEVNRLFKGANSGWLKIMGPDSRNATYGENGNTNFDAGSLTYLPGAAYIDPEFSFLSPIGITALGFIDSKRFPEDLQYEVLFGDNNTGNLYLAHLQTTRTSFKLTGNLADKVADTGSERDKLVVGTGFIVTTDIRVGADGYLYLAELGTGDILRIRPVTDLVEPSAFRVDLGAQTHGKLADLDRSDDEFVRLEDIAPMPLLQQVMGTATFTLNESSPASVQLSVEMRATQGDSVQEILVKDPASGDWVSLDLRRTTRTDTALTLDLTNPATFVAPDRTIQIRVHVRDIALTSGGPPGPSTLKVRIDQLRLSVTYP